MREKVSAKEAFYRIRELCNQSLASPEIIKKKFLTQIDFFIRLAEADWLLRTDGPHRKDRWNRLAVDCRGFSLFKELSRDIEAWERIQSFIHDEPDDRIPQNHSQDGDPPAKEMTKWETEDLFRDLLFKVNGKYVVGGGGTTFNEGGFMSSDC